MHKSPSLSDQLDEAVEIVMRNRDASLPAMSPRLAALLRVAADLRGLPSSRFKARLQEELLAGTPGAKHGAASAAAPVRTLDEIEARLREMAREPKLVPHDVRAALSGLPELTMRFLASLNQHTIGVSRFSEHSHWERHPAGDELLHFLEGEAEIITLTDAGPVESMARAGSIFICPRGLWHRIQPRSPVLAACLPRRAGTRSTRARWSRAAPPQVDPLPQDTREARGARDRRCTAERAASDHHGEHDHSRG